MNRGDIYRSGERIAERGGKPGYYAIVSRQFIVENEDVSTVICAPVYSEVLGISTEVVIGVGDGLPRRSAIRCDFLCLVFKRSLTTFIARLGEAKLEDLDRALLAALDLPS